MIPTCRDVLNALRPRSSGLTRKPPIALLPVNRLKSHLTASDLERKTMSDDLEALDENLYRGTRLWKSPFASVVFGGALIRQGLSAAARTVTNEQSIHSMHGYFIRPGDPRLPVLYHIDRTRDSSSFTSRSVTAYQNSKVILTLQSSYNLSNEKPAVLRHALSYQRTMSQVPHHSSIALPDILTQIIHLDASEKSPERIKELKIATQEIPLELKPVDPATWYRKLAATEPRSYFWVRTREKIGKDPNLHSSMVGYISDWCLLWTAFVQYPDFRLAMLVSLDHSVWFHQPVQADKWMLFECEASVAENCLALVTGKLYREDGTHAVTVIQQGLLRPHIPESKL